MNFILTVDFSLDQIKWRCKPFAELTSRELHDILQLRSTVFHLEQRCLFLDIDGNDPVAHHLWGEDKDGKVVATTRLFDFHKSYEGHQSIGRVCCSPLYRKHGLGRELMRQSISSLQEIFGHGSIKIGGQLYLRNFYESYGFVQVGNVYIDEGIEHIYMIRPQST
jgi:ElaA protein